jgi:hypothetical protein
MKYILTLLLLTGCSSLKIEEYEKVTPNSTEVSVTESNVSTIEQTIPEQTHIFESPANVKMREIAKTDSLYYTQDLNTEIETKSASVPDPQPKMSEINGKAWVMWTFLMLCIIGLFAFRGSYGQKQETPI